MARVKFVPDDAGIQAFLKSADVAALISSYGANVAARAGEGFEMDTQNGKYRAICRISAETDGAKRKTYMNTLLKALHK
jgi:hypothetical protein